MPELRFEPRESEAWATARVMVGDTCFRTIGPAAHELHFEVPAFIAAAARKAQEESFRDFSKGESELNINGVGDARLLRYLGRDEELQPLFAWIAEQGLAVMDPDGTWLTAHEVGFHTDPVHAYSTAFLVWQVAGPSKVLEFPQVGRAYRMEPGSIAVFDGAAPHGLRLPQLSGQPFDEAEKVLCAPQSADDVSVFLSVDMPWTTELEKLLGIRVFEAAGDDVDYDIDAATGHMKV